MAGVLSFLLKIKDFFKPSVSSSRVKTQDAFTLLAGCGVTSFLYYRISTRIYKCPLEEHYRAGMMFLMGPVIPLYALSLATSRELNHGLSGFCRTSHFRMHRCIAAVKFCTINFVGCLLKSLVVPLTWLVLALTHGRIYACMIVGPHPSLRNGTVTAEYAVAHHQAEVRSLTYGWILFMTAILIGCLLHIAHQCCRKPPAESGALAKYNAYEAKAAHDVFERLMEIAAKENARKQVADILGRDVEHMPKLTPEGHDYPDSGGDTKDGEKAVNSTFSMTYEENLADLNVGRYEIAQARSALLRAYPRLVNQLDHSLPWLDDDWEERSMRKGISETILDNMINKLMPSRSLSDDGKEVVYLEKLRPAEENDTVEEVTSIEKPQSQEEVPSYRLSSEKDPLLEGNYAVPNHAKQP